MRLIEALIQLEKLRSDAIMVSESDDGLGKAHVTHVEDLVLLKGSAGAEYALKALQQTISQPEKITVKWDGSPALIFGYGTDMKFRIMDKHMFDKTDSSGRNVFSPKDFQQYDIARGADRGELSNTIAILWKQLLAATPRKPGFYWGDLLWPEKNTDAATQPSGYKEQNQSEVLQFKPNPGGIVYKINSDSDVGRYVRGKLAGIGIHQVLPADAPELAEKERRAGNKKAKATNFATSLDGSLGELNRDRAPAIAILPSKLDITPRIKPIDTSQYSSSISTMASSIDKLLGPISNANKTTQEEYNNLYPYFINRRVEASINDPGSFTNLPTKFLQFVKERVPAKIKNPQYQQLIFDHIAQNKQGVNNLFRVWALLYKLKMMVYKQINAAVKKSPVQGYLETGQSSQEGFVSHGLKFVDRVGFSAQNLAMRQRKPVTEAIDNKQTLVIYPGGFHPFHLGHASVFDHLAHKFPNGEVFVAATDTKTERPFGFDDKKFLANQSGVPKDRFVQVKSPYKANEITSNYDPENTILVFAVSEKDSDRFNFAPKKDGSPSYFQPYSDNSTEPMSRHGYIYIVPKIDFEIAGQVIDSASKIRNMYTSADDDTRTDIISDLYPLAKAPKKIKAILDRVLGGLNEADNPDYFGGGSLSPLSQANQQTSEPDDSEEYDIQLKKLKKWMGHKT